ncbi:MAG: hypothetical protein V3V72_02985 [Ignavibacteriaceae bacterium]
MNLENELKILSNSWWESHRLKYNIGLIIAGVLAFVFYTIVFETKVPFSPENEITLFTTLFQGIGYLIMMGIANFFYFLGPISEKIFNPNNVDKFRKVTFNLGFWFTFILPFSIPVMLLFTYW